MSQGSEMLGYATAGVRTAPRRTWFRIILRLFGQLILLLIRAAQCAIIALGYLALVLSVALRHLVAFAGRTLLRIGRLQWPDFVRGYAWLATRIVRPWNRLGMFVGRVSRRAVDVPLAATHSHP